LANKREREVDLYIIKTNRKCREAFHLKSSNNENSAQNVKKFLRAIRSHIWGLSLLFWYSICRILHSPLLKVHRKTISKEKSILGLQLPSRLHPLWKGKGTPPNTSPYSNKPTYCPSHS